MEKFEKFTVNVSGGCPVCGSCENDKFDSSEPVDELFCGSCGTAFHLKTGLQLKERKAGSGKVRDY